MSGGARHRMVQQLADREVGHGVAHTTPVALAREDSSLIQDSKMFRDVLLRQRRRPCRQAIRQLLDRGLAVPQQRHDPHPRRLADSLHTTSHEIE